MGWTNHHTCDCCGKAFVTDNAWILCEGPELRVTAHFCSNDCRTRHLVNKGWKLDPLHRLRPPEEFDAEGNWKN